MGNHVAVTVGGSQGITVELESVDLCVTFKTIRLINLLARMWMPVQAPAPKMQRPQVGAGRRRREAVPRVRTKEDQATNEFIVTSSSICLTLINDKQQRSMPSLRLSITDANFHVLGSNKAYQALGRFVIGAQYYNIKFAEWQQLLILPRIEAEIDSSEDHHRVSLESVAVPSMVVTDAVLATLVGVKAALSEEEEGDAGLAKIINNTGLGIFYWTSAEQPSCEPEQVLPTGRSANIGLASPYASEQAEDAGEWEFEEQLDNNTDWTGGLVTWTPYEMTASASIEACYQLMLSVGGRLRPQLLEVRVRCSAYIDAVEMIFSGGLIKVRDTIAWPCRP